MKSKKKRIEILTLALGIAAMPPLWAVLAPRLGVTVGAVALICAGLYVTNGNQREDALKITVGFLCGDLWAAAALLVMDRLDWDPSLELYVTLFFMGGLAVIIGSVLEKWIFLPAWLCGWAIGLTVMGAVPLTEVRSLTVQIAAAMAAGVIYVGAGVNWFQHVLIRMLTGDEE